MTRSRQNGAKAYADCCMTLGKSMVVIFLMCILALTSLHAAQPPTAISQNGSFIRHSVIEPATEKTPRSDTASVIELADGRLMVAYHKYEMSEKHGDDFGRCSIWSKISADGGITWSAARQLVDAAEGDINVQAPALVRLSSGDIILACLRTHQGGNSSTMCILKSTDSGVSFRELTRVWQRSEGQLLQGGASSLVLLSTGRLLLPFHGGTGHQWKQKNSAWCCLSDDNAKTWRKSSAIELPKRGAMEGSVAEAADGTLLMSLRTQLGGPYLARSKDHGQTWSKAAFTGLEGGESCTALRRIPGTEDIVLFWNNSKFDTKHHHFGKRSPLTVAVSSDNGGSWRTVGNLEEDPQAEYTNLDCFFTSKGDAVVTYMYARPAFNRKRISLKAAIVPKAWFYKNRPTTRQ